VSKGGGGDGGGPRDFLGEGPGMEGVEAAWRLYGCCPELLVMCMLLFVSMAGTGPSSLVLCVP
jgi:hypothetical protein